MSQLQLVVATVTWVWTEGWNNSGYIPSRAGLANICHAEGLPWHASFTAVQLFISFLRTPSLYCEEYVYIYIYIYIYIYTYLTA